LERLAVEGVPPAEAMRSWADWVAHIVPAGSAPVLVALNAPFDWMFVSVYFYRYLGHNPFGHAALDIKAYYMGLHGVAWDHTGYRQIRGHHPGAGALGHQALSDALDEAQLFRVLLAARRMVVSEEER
jgi:hypothetical protein